MCSFARSTRRRCSSRSGKRSSRPELLVPRGRSGCGPSSADESPMSTSATPRAWSNRISTSGTRNWLSGKSGPSSGSGTVGSRRATASYPRYPTTGSPSDSASSNETSREPRPTNEYRPSRPRSTDSSRNAPRAPGRRRRYAPSGVRRSVAITVSGMKKAPSGAGLAEWSSNASVSARSRPAMSARPTSCGTSESLRPSVGAAQSRRQVALHHGQLAFYRLQMSRRPWPCPDCRKQGYGGSLSGLCGGPALGHRAARIFPAATLPE